ncbi:DUF1765-domain-containing protein [Pseudovirgaria hyperparasitica]|uniref:DUF1765-domain-containing protein n=1 Tax=Pseudovirgaria hyperparasitica TaxID=470096 RepID=A0A6A6WH84_9PEZI|nr:DUF1765-domain-containing protein [Pseudovirgaria hyperparasitica]KAF2761430.1 DUF1765-domain-containing protein [Pseudovirgaria hyperparasitica]
MPSQMSTTRVSPSAFTSNRTIREESEHSDKDAVASTSPRKSDTDILPRTASYTYFAKAKESLFEDNKILELKGTITEDDLAASSTTTGDGDSSSSSTGPDSEPSLPLEIKPSLSSSPRKSTKNTVSRLLGWNKSQDEPEQRQSRPSTDSGSSRSASRPGSRLRRKSWMPQAPADTTRETGSSAPTNNSERDIANGDQASGTHTEDETSPRKLSEDQRSRSWTLGAGRRMSMIGRSRERDKGLANNEEGVIGEHVPNKRTLLKSIPRPSSMLIRSRTTDNISPERQSQARDVPAVPQLPISFSTDRLPTTSNSPIKEHLSPTDRVPSLPRQRSSDRLRASNIKGEPQRKKDELWTVFRTLDGDYQKFQSKSIALKTNVVRSTLTPFLRTYAEHASNHKLRAEDLDRRANILNKWWTGLLEMLAGRNNQSISGTDRPAILEAVSGIMERPEWRLRPSPFSPITNSGLMTPAPQTKSTTSLSSTNSDFLIESVQHNVRNIFTQNIMSQMSFVIAKMSLRNAPASLVSFCGKTCAYAFFFCPGIADMLIRLWNPSPDVMRRVMEENGAPRLEKFERTAKTILAFFPPNLHSLKVSSFRQICQELRKPCQLPLGAAHLDWHGPWTKRWYGTESDLFYVFVKYFHVLTNEFLPPDTTNLEKLCAPGVLMVHTQILANLDATIHRHANASVGDDTVNGPSTITFDDVLQGDPDAAAAPVPIGPTNATRLMAENRLIMLLRDILSERTANVTNVRPMFAELFCQLLKASARKVSLYDHNASYMLCDFLEEVVGIIVRYEQSSKTLILDWPFWLSVCRKMAESHNTATEIRLYSFLYSTWNSIIADPDRKTDTCLDFLLDPDFFESRFNHWCPMVRSYYMRLLCWRVARFDGDPSDGDIIIFDRLLDQLRGIWSHFLFIRERAQRAESVPPSTIPCPPAPGRRLLIIRTDAPVHSPAGSFLSFDGIVSPHSSIQKSDSVLQDIETRPSSSMSDASSDYGQSTEEKTKKPWNLFKSLIGMPSSPRSKSRSPSSKERTSAKTSGSTTPTFSQSATTTTTTTTSVPTHRSYCFRFSLEWQDKRLQIVNNMRLYAPRLPGPAQQYLIDHGRMLPTVRSRKPEGAAASSSKYAGRALAEWSMVVNECQNFFERRKHEGVPTNSWVETPTLSVEHFKRPS